MPPSSSTNVISDALPATMFVVGPCLVDTLKLEVSSPAGVSVLEPKVMETLALFATRPGGLWSRQEMIDALWPKGEGGDESLTRVVYMLRKTLLDDHAVAHAIRTVPKRGYILQSPVTRQTAPPATATARDRGPAVTHDPLSVAVLPVLLSSLDDADFFLAEGLTRDLTALLSKGTGLSVAAYSTVQHLAAQSLPQSELATRAGVTYLLEGYLRKKGSRMRLRMDLIEAQSGKVVWAGKYDATIDELLEIEEDVLLSISTAVSAKMKMPQRTLFAARGPLKRAAYELVQATETLRLIYSREIAMQIRDLLSEALAIEPDNAVLRAALAVQISQNCVSQWVDDVDSSIQAADEHIHQALQAGGDDPDVIASAGVVAAMFHRPAEAIGHLSRAVDLDPNNAHALAVLGWQKCLLNDDRSGLDDIRNAEARAPHHPRFGLWATYRCTAHLFMCEHDLAVPACREAIARTPNYYQPYLSLAWALTGAGDVSAADAEIAKAEAIQHVGILPEFVAEMRKWSANSPNKAETGRVLDELGARRTH